VGDVAQQRATDLLRQRVNLDVVALGPTHANDLLLPVQIIQRQPRHLADAKPVGGEQEQCGPTPNVGRAVCVVARDNALHIGPRRAGRQRFLIEESRPRNRGRDARTTMSLAFGIAKECPQRLAERRGS